jgi:hypothetical protein
LSLVDAGAGGTCASNSISKCFTDITVTVTAACALTVTPNDPDTPSNIAVPALFSNAAAYTDLVFCPDEADAALTTTIANDDAVWSGLRTVLTSSIWETALTGLGLPAAAGGVVSTTDSNSGCALQWQVVSAAVRKQRAHPLCAPADPATTAPPPARKLIAPAASPRRTAGAVHHQVQRGRLHHRRPLRRDLHQLRRWPVQRQYRWRVWLRLRAVPRW